MKVLKYSIFALLGVVLCGSLAWRAVALRDLDERAFVLPSGFPATEIVLKGSQRTVSAVLFHGFQCNRIMMMELGRYLAQAGIHVFLLDLPGHGASTLRFAQETVVQHSVTAFAELVDLHKISPATTVVIGHSFGGIVAMNVATSNPSTPSTALIGPRYNGGASVEGPKNVLVLTGAQDHRHIIDAAGRLIADSTSGKGYLNGPLVGQPPFLRLWKSVPATGHLALLYKRGTFDETLSWIRQSQIAEAHDLGDPRSFVGIAAAPAVVGFVLFVAVFLGTAPRRPPAPTSATNGAEMVLPFLTMPLSAFWVRYLDPLAAQRILEGSIIVSTLLLSGLLTGGMILIRGVRRAPSRTSLKQLVVAVANFCLIYFIARLTVSSDFYDLALKPTGQRISAFVLFSLCSGMFFSVMGGILDRLHGSVSRRSIRILMMAAMLAVLSLVPPLSLSVTGSTLQRFFAPMAIVLLFLFGLRVVLLEASRECRPCSTFSGLVVGWVISVGFLAY